MTTETQAAPPMESRTERAAVTLTKTEKDALRLVAIVDKTDESTLLRNGTVAEIVTRAEEIRRKMEAA